MRQPPGIDGNTAGHAIRPGANDSRVRLHVLLAVALSVWLAVVVAGLALAGLAAQVAVAQVAVAQVAGDQVAHAAGSAGTVSFQRRDYDVQISANGDVGVAEHWVVQFSGGPYTKAHLDLYLTHTGGIDFGTVDGATPSSQQVSGATDADGNVMRELTWTYPSAQDTTRSFTIPYTIHGAIGLNSTQAWFDWHFLDGNGTTDFAVDSSTVTETLPAPASTGVQVTATYPGQQPQTATPTSTTATASAQNLNTGQPFEVLVVFPRSQLGSSVQQPSWQQGDTPPTPPTSITGSSGSGSSGGSPGGSTGIGGGTTLPSTGVGPSAFGSLFSGICGSLLCPGIVVVLLLSLISRLAWRHSGVGAPMGGWGYNRGPWGMWGGPYGGYGAYGPGPRAPIFGGGTTPPGGGTGAGGSSGFGGGGGGGGGTGGGGGGSSGFG